MAGFMSPRHKEPCPYLCYDFPTMNARTAARELALLSLFQMEKQGDLPADAASLRKVDLKDLVLASVRALVGEAEDNIKTAAEELADISRNLMTYEAEHPDNLARPMGDDDQPVPVPTTRETVEKIERCLQGAEFLYDALRIPEIIGLAKQDDVKSYAIKLMGLVLEHEAELDEQLNKHMQDWRMDRLIKMDRYILRLAAAEMRYVESVDPGVSINEAVELTKKYSSEYSYRLINGVLGALAEELAASGAGSV